MTEITLAIETSNPSAGGPRPASGAAGSVCVGYFAKDGSSQVLAAVGLSPASRHDDALMPAVAEACARAGVSPSGIARVAVSVGPGGFTSLRIAVTTAKMIAEATGAACIPVPTASALALAAHVRGTRGTLGVLLAWKREDVWRRRFLLREPHHPASGGGVEPVDDGGIVTLARALDGCDAVVAEDALREMLSGTDSTGRHVRVAVLAPEFDAAWVLRASAIIEPVEPALLLPIYPREPEAVTKWRALGKAKGAG